MTEAKSPVDQALDLLVYAPLGFASSLPEVLPQLAEKGRQRATMARAVGEFAVQMGVDQGGKLLRRVLGGSPPGRSPASPSGPAPQTSAAAPPRPSAPAPPSDGLERPAANSSPSASAPRTAPTSPSAARGAALAIPGYDSLSASQVVARLAGLTRQELEAVRTYEEAGRGRKTVLNRIAQLQADA